MAAESSEDDRTCMICMSEPRAVRFHPCGHSVACELCTLQIIAKCPGSRKPDRAGGANGAPPPEFRNDLEDYFRLIEQ